MTQDVVGQMRDPQKEPGKLEFPNLVISLAESSAGTFYAWFQDMVIKGNAGENNEKAGTLELLDPTLSDYAVDDLFQSPRHFRIYAGEVGRQCRHHQAGQGRNVLRADDAHAVEDIGAEPSWRWLPPGSGRRVTAARAYSKTSSRMLK